MNNWIKNRIESKRVSAYRKKMQNPPDTWTHQRAVWEIELLDEIEKWAEAQEKEHQARLKSVTEESRLRVEHWKEEAQYWRDAADISPEEENTFRGWTQGED